MSSSDGDSSRRVVVVVVVLVVVLVVVVVVVVLVEVVLEVVVVVVVAVVLVLVFVVVAVVVVVLAEVGGWGVSPTGKSYSFRSCVRACEAACACEGRCCFPSLGLRTFESTPCVCARALPSLS